MQAALRPPGALRAALAAAASQVGQPDLALLFVSDDSAAERLAALEHLAHPALGFPVALVPVRALGTGLAGLGRASQVAGVVLSGVRPTLRRGHDSVRAPPEGAEAQRPSDGDFTLVLLDTTSLIPGQAAPVQASTAWLELGTAAPTLTLGAQGQLSDSGSMTLLTLGQTEPRCTLVALPCAPPDTVHRITESRGSLVLTLDDEPALDALRRASPQTRGLLVALVAHSKGLQDVGGTFAESRNCPAVLTLRGVDGPSSGLMLSGRVEPGATLGFAACGHEVAKKNFEAMLRAARRALDGALPSWGLYLKVAAANQPSFTNLEADLSAIRRHFGTLPVCGAAISIAACPGPGRPSLQTLAGIFTLFASPS